MPRINGGKRARTTPPRKFKDEDMRKAISLVFEYEKAKVKGFVARAAAECGVETTSLQWYANKQLRERVGEAGCIKLFDEREDRGRRPFFTKQDEDALYALPVRGYRKGYPFTKEQILAKAALLAEARNLEWRNQHKLPSEDWYVSFMHRHELKNRMYVCFLISFSGLRQLRLIRVVFFTGVL
jgi:hypothetical protein